MSAIAGILYFGGAPVEPGLIQKLTDAMRRRGPDEQTHWVHGSVALGHCMLRTTPESLEEHQPLISQDKNLVLVWDGRLDNREELQHDLIAAGAILRDNSDAELALHSYERWGEESPKRLLGDFAFAVWDAIQCKLFCARDHMGARPFYYTQNDRFFAFASEDEALLGLPDVSHQPNEELIAHLLVPAFVSFDSRRSWLQDVLRLLPAHLIAISNQGVLRKASYWTLVPGEEAAYSSEQECRDAFLDVFSEAVRCRMRVSGNIAAMVSGGLDSAGIAAMVKRLLPEFPGKEFHTYSAIYDEPESCLESQCILSLTKDLSTSSHVLSVPSFHGMADVNDLIETAWPKAHLVDNSILLPAMMCLAASRNGNRVILHGVSGDLTTHVPDRYASYLMSNGAWRLAWHECRGASRNHTFLRNSSPLLIWLQNVWAAYTPEKLKNLVGRLRGQRSHSSRSVINSSFARKLNLKDRLRDQASSQARPSFRSIRNDHAALLNSPTFGVELGLTGYEHMAGRFGVELRDPWSDKRVIEFFLHLPLSYKIRKGWTKYLVRAAFVSELDAVVASRMSKEHLGWRFADRLMAETRDFVSRTLEKDLEVIENYVDPKAVLARYRHYLATENDVDREFFYDLMTLILWLKRISK